MKSAKGLGNEVSVSCATQSPLVSDMDHVPYRIVISDQYQYLEEKVYVFAFQELKGTTYKNVSSYKSIQLIAFFVYS